MLTSVSGYYNGTEIVMDEAVNLDVGQRVIVTILTATEKDRNKKKVSLKKYVGHGAKMFSEDAGEYIKELRSHDRI